MVELTEREELLDILSDVYKSVHGFRPRGKFTNYTVAELRAELDRLDRAYEETSTRERAQEEASAVKFEGRIASLILIGAGDRKTAIRWDKESYDDPYMLEDDNYYEYHHGLKHGYLRDHGDE